MAEQQSAAVEAPATAVEAMSSPPSLLEIIESVAGETANTSQSVAAAPANGNAKQPAPGFVDPLDEANFTAEKLATPEGIQAARETLQKEIKAALDLRRKAHSALSKSEMREQKVAAKIKGFLGEKQATNAQIQMLQREIQELQTGDPEKFIQAVGRLANARDPYEFWNKAAVALAKGKPVELESPKIPKEVQERLDRIEAERAAEIAAREEQQIMDLRVAQLNEARTFTDLGYVSSLANEQPALVDARLVAIRREHFDRTGKAIDTRTACGILESEIRSHFDLLQRAGNPNGALNGERGASPPAGNLAGKPELTAKPETPQRSAIPAVTAIPSALTAAPASTKRALTEAEAREAKIAELDRLGLFANLGM